MTRDKDEKTAYEKWHDGNKDTLNKTRKDRYHDDPDYRKKQIMAARKYRAETKMPKGAIRGVVRGDPQNYYPLKVVLEWLQYSEDELLHLEHNNLLKSPAIVDGERYYTKKQVIIVKTLIKKMDSVTMTDRQWGKWKLYLKENWNG